MLGAQERHSSDLWARVCRLFLRIELLLDIDLENARAIQERVHLLLLGVGGVGDERLIDGGREVGIG